MLTPPKHSDTIGLGNGGMAVLEISDWLMFQEAAAGWLSAVGTTGAAMAAVWLGLREGRWRAHKADVDAKIVADVIRPEAELLLRRIRAMRTSLHTVSMQDVREPRNLLNRELIRHHGAQPALVIAAEFISSLHVLGELRGAAMARVIGRLSMLRQALTLAAMEPGGENEIRLIGVGMEEAMRLLAVMHEDLRVALNLSDIEVQAILEHPVPAITEHSERYRKLHEAAFGPLR